MKRAYSDLLKKYKILKIVHDFARAAYNKISHSQYASKMKPKLKRENTQRYFYNYEVFYSIFHNHDFIIQLYQQNKEWKKDAYSEYQGIAPDQGKLMFQCIAAAFEAWNEARRVMSLSYATKEKGLGAGYELIKNNLKFSNVPKKIPKEAYNIKRPPRMNKKIIFEIEQENIDQYEHSTKIIKRRLSNEKNKKKSDKSEMDGIVLIFVLIDHKY